MKLCSTRSSNHVLANLGVKDRCAFAATCKQYHKASGFFYAGLRDNEVQFVTELGLSWNYFDLTPFALNGKMLERMDYWVENGERWCTPTALSLAGLERALDLRADRPMHAWLGRALNRATKIVDAGRLIGQLSRVVSCTSERLTTLDLTSSHLTGTLSDISDAPCVQLRKLTLSDTWRIEGNLEDLRLTSLTHVVMHEAEMIEVECSEVASLPCAKTLKLLALPPSTCGKLEELGAEKLISLEKLYVRSTNIKGSRSQHFRAHDILSLRSKLPRRCRIYSE